MKTNGWKSMNIREGRSSKEAIFWLPAIEVHGLCRAMCVLFWVAFLPTSAVWCWNCQGLALSWITPTTPLVVCILTFWSEICVSLNGGSGGACISGYLSYFRIWFAMCQHVSTLFGIWWVWELGTSQDCRPCRFRTCFLSFSRSTVQRNNHPSDVVVWWSRIGARWLFDTPWSINIKGSMGHAVLLQLIARIFRSSNVLDSGQWLDRTCGKVEFGAGLILQSSFFFVYFPKAWHPSKW